MRVNQTIKIGTFSVNTMSNSAILQIGTSGAIKARSEEITEHITPQQAEQTLEQTIHKKIEPILKKEGLPIEIPGAEKKQPYSPIFKPTPQEQMLNVEED